MNPNSAFRRERPIRLKAGLAAPPELAADIALDMDVSGLPAEEGGLADFAAAVDFVLVAAQSGLDTDLQARLFGADPSYRTALFGACESRRVPVVLWRLDGSIAAGDLAPFAGGCTAMFAASPELAGFGADTEILPAGVQVARYHPYLTLETYVAPESRAVAGHGRFEGGDTQSLPEIGVRLNAAEPDERARALRSAFVTIVHAARLTPDDIAPRCLESGASGSLPVVIGGPALPPHLAGIAACVADGAAAADLVATLRADPIEARRRAHLAWRAVFAEHTLTHRLDRIARAAGLHSGWQPWPLVTVFVPTYRVQFLARCVENYRKQRYAPRELVLALHADDPPRDDIARIMAENGDVRIVTMPREETVGSLMNLALHVANGVYCVKMDDDDYYGENYVLDMILAQRAVTMDIFGKPPAFTYFEASDQTCRRLLAGSKENCLVGGASLISNEFRITGSTHSGRTEFLRSVLFCARSRGAADTSLYERCETRDVVGATLDAFNTAAFRAADQSKHTWRQADERLLDGAIHVGAGYPSEAVEI